VNVPVGIVTPVRVRSEPQRILIKLYGIPNHKTQSPRLLKMSIQFISSLFPVDLPARLKSTVIAMLLISLTACGGGGGNNDPDPIPPAEPFTLAQAGPLDLYVGDTLTNTASGPGADGVSYESADPRIATVDATTGVVTGVRPGTVTINALKLVNVPNRSSQLIAAKAPYTVNVLESGPAFSARYFHKAVDFNNQLWIIDGRDSDDLKSDTWASTDAITWTQQVIGSTFSPRAGHAAVVFNNRLWVIGGFDGVEDRNDVWSSADGLTWTEETAHAAFPARQAFQVTVYNNRLWLIGGRAIATDGSAIEQSDVWSSADGITWRQETASAAFPARHYHQVAVYHSRLWLIAGQSTDANGAETEYNDVWSSADGITWIQETATAAFSARQMPQVVVYNNLLWLIAGNDGSKNLNDVWSSSDGINWIEQAAEAKFSKRSAHQVAVFDNKLILVGGFSNAELNDVWSSTDGVDWLVVYKGAFRAP
jgi:Big-like domain-containing protein/Kelch motif protein